MDSLKKSPLSRHNLRFNRLEKIILLLSDFKSFNGCHISKILDSSGIVDFADTNIGINFVDERQQSYQM